MTIESISSAIYNDVVSGLRGITSNPSMSLEQLQDAEKYGMILRAKGIVMGVDGQWIHFDYVPGEPNVRLGFAEIIGRLCVIGANIDKEKIAEIFRV